MSSVYPCWLLLSSHPKTGGRVAILYRSTLSVSGKSNDVQYTTFESLHAEVSGNSKSVRLVIVYRPERDSNGQHVTFSSFLREFENLILEYLLHPSEIIITGDFNIHVDDVHNTNANQFKHLLQAFGLTQHIKEPTHRLGHCLDLVITRDISPPIASNFIILPGLSDHYAVMCNLSLCKPKVPTVTIKSRQWKHVNSPEVFHDIGTHLANLEVDHDCLDSYVSQYESTVSDILDKYAPWKTRSVKVRTEVSWFNDDIRTARKICRQLERKWRKNGKLAIQRQEYRNQCKVVRNLINQAKIIHYSSQVQESSGDQKKLFKIIGKLLLKPKTPVLPSTYNNQDLANEFQKFFVTKISDIRSSFSSVPYNVPQTLPHLQPECRLSVFEPATVAEIQRVIMKSPSKSCELDPVSTSMIKQNIDIFVPYIFTKLVNESLSSGCFPDSLKVSYIRPLIKKPNLDKEIFQNYRPVANLKYLGKVIERVVSSRISDHIHTFNLSDVFQSAYKPFHGTEAALVRVSNDILSSMDNGNLTALVLLDLSAAFDTVDHNILLSRLQNHLGIEDTALAWCKSYLHNRTQHVCIGTAISDPVVLNYSVPQGSVLGPQWFTLYTLPIRDIILKFNLNYHVYADDTQLYITFKSSQENANASIARLEKCIQEIRRWTQQNFLKLNDDKTEFLLFGSRQQLTKVSVPYISIGDARIAPSLKARNLGVIFDSSMTLQPHQQHCSFIIISHQEYR